MDDNKTLVFYKEPHGKKNRLNITLDMMIMTTLDNYV